MRLILSAKVSARGKHFGEISRILYRAAKGIFAARYFSQTLPWFDGRKRIARLRIVTLYKLLSFD
jgi:hypothetical protein